MKANKITSIIIEGIDRVGKDSLIQGLLHELGYFQVVHFEKPKQLNCYGDYEAGTNKLDKLAAFRYQQESFKNMFKMMSSNARFIFNRAHLGECVYSPLYRGYHGDYVFDLEAEFASKDGPFPQNTMLVLLYAPDLRVLKDDGQSFDASKKGDEQRMFREAFQASHIPNKVAVSVTHDPNQLTTRRSIVDDATDDSGFRGKEQVLMEVLSALHRFETT